MRKIVFSLLMVSVLTMCGNSCSKASEDMLAAPCDSTNASYSRDVVPILSINCYTCHDANNGPIIGQGVVFDSYDNLLNYLPDTSLVGTITHNPDYVAMPYNKPMLDTCEINKILSWVNNGAQNN